MADPECAMAAGAIRIVVGPLTSLVPGEVRTVQLASHDVASRARREGLVLRDADGGVRAYLNRCRHLPIPLDAATGEYLSEDGAHILCSTHGALYRLEDGLCVRGPCEGEHLYALPIEIEDGLVYLLDDSSRAR